MAYNFTRVSLGRRLAAISVDWLACYFIVAASAGGIGKMGQSRPVTVLGLFFLEVAILTALQGASLGHRIFGIRVVRFIDGGAATPIQSLVRTALLITVIFAVTFDENGRGLHERFSQTVLTRV